MNCNPTTQQRKAIEAPLGPVLVIAGPGAGKTYCLIHRIQHLIQELAIPPRRILAVTFTNKAAEEIATRLHETRGVAAVDVTRGTLHAICLMILRDFAEGCGLRQGFGVADREYQEKVLRRLRIPAKRCSHALSLFSRYRLQGKPLGDRGMAFYAQYRDALRARNLADFDDLIALTEQLLRTDSRAAAELRSRWDYVLVDEFQDLNATQYGIVRRLADSHRGLFGVGDDEQSIFSWTGADPGIIHRFREDFGLTTPVVLDENRRCSIQILDSARRLIACNPVLFPKQIDTSLQSPFEVVAHGFENEEAEASWLIGDIFKDRAAAGTGWGDYAVLYRYRWMGRDLEKRLICAGIPCRMARGQALADDKVVGWVIASLRVIRSAEDPILMGALAELALPGALRQEIRKTSSPQRDFLGNLRAFASQRPRGDADRKRAWRLIYHIENLRGMGRSHQTLSGLVDELLARPIGAGRNPLEDYHHELSEPSLYPGAAILAKRLEQCLASGARVWVEAGGGLEIPLVAMLRGAGITNAGRLTSSQMPAREDFVIKRGEADGWPLRIFKALQLLHTAELKTDFDDFVAFDVETSDFDFEACGIIEIAAVRVRGKVVVEGFHSLVACTRPISAEATDVHGYRDQDLAGAPQMSEVWCRFRDFVGSDTLVAHNGQEFDVPVLRRACGGFDGFEDLVFYDTLPLARAVVDGSVKLTFLAQKFNVEVGRAHHALDDALMLAGVVPALSELRLRRARKIALVNLLDQLGLALALDQQSSTSKEDALFRDITRPYTLGRYSDCLDVYASELEAGADGAPAVEEVIDRLGGQALMARLRAERPVDERYAGSIDRLRMLIQASARPTVGEHIDEMLCRVALSTSTEVETDPNRINLLTLHSTKGLEFSRVYIIGVENQVLPGWRAIQEERTEEIQEGRRLLYVGMTRARHRLVLTHSERRGGYDAQGKLFLTEAGLALEDAGIPHAQEVPAIFD
ncbi:MAG TPA: UvrD-helicase domain-containing protein [Gemmatimonadales bacterium]|nr:UvrD-helicase domain-containing protein [Gemmatimonadales bacterium]